MLCVRRKKQRDQEKRESDGGPERGMERIGGKRDATIVFNFSTVHEEEGNEAAMTTAAMTTTTTVIVLNSDQLQLNLHQLLLESETKI